MTSDAKKKADELVREAYEQFQANAERQRLEKKYLELMRRNETMNLAIHTQKMRAGMAGGPRMSGARRDMDILDVALGSALVVALPTAALPLKSVVAGAMVYEAARKIDGAPASRPENERGVPSTAHTRRMRI